MRKLLSIGLLMLMLSSSCYSMEKESKPEKKKRTEHPTITIIKTKPAKEIDTYLRNNQAEWSRKDRNRNSLVQVALLHKRDENVIKTVLKYDDLKSQNKADDDAIGTVIALGESMRKKYIPLLAEKCLSNLSENNRLLAQELSQAPSEELWKIRAYFDLMYHLPQDQS